MFLSHRFSVYILVLVGLAVYANALRNGFVGDDIYQIVHNPTIHLLTNFPHFFLGSTYYNASPDTLIGVYYRPLMITFYSILYTLNGANPHLFHLIQIFLHITNAILIYFFFKKFFPSLYSLFLALIFLVHPQNNEAVVYIANLQDTLFLFFGLIGFLLLLYKPKKYLLAVFFFFLSLLSKETGILFVGLSLLYYFLYQRKLFPRLIAWITFMLLLYFILRVPIAHIGFSYSPVAPITLASFAERLLTIPAIILFYVQTFFFPLHISALHFWVVKTPGVETFYLPLFMLFSIFSGIYWFWYTQIRTNKKRSRGFIFFSVWIISGVIIHLHLITPLDATAADRWFYFSFIGMLGMIGVSSEGFTFTPLLKRLVILTLVLIIILLGIRTAVRNTNWKDTITLYEHDLPKSTPNFLSNNALGTEYLNEGDYQKAKPFISASVNEYPYFANLNNAAIIALHEKDPSQAKRYLQAALKTSNHYRIYENYSSFLIKYGTKREARAFTQKALQKFPHSKRLAQNSKLLQEK